MEKGKLIVIEGTDCSGKETQSKKLIRRLNDEKIDTVYYSFPKYNTPTGRIVGLPYLGKPYLAEELIVHEADNVLDGLGENYPNIDRVLKIMNILHPEEFSAGEVQYINEIIKTTFGLFYGKDKSIKRQLVLSIILSEVIDSISHGWFKEGAPNVDPKVASLYYAADRKYNLPEINQILESGNNIVLDRYTYSSMAHQGGKIEEMTERDKMFEWIASLEFDLLGLPHSDARIFLHMPTDYSAILKEKREEALDEHEKDCNHLYHAERAYLELAQKYDFKTIECVKKEHDMEPKLEDIKTEEEIGEEVYSCVKKELKLQ